MKAIPSNKMEYKHYEVFEKVAFDWKYSPIRSRRGYNGFFLFYCKRSRWYFIYFSPRKKYVLSAIKSFYLYHRTIIEKEILLDGNKKRISYITKLFQCDSEVINIQNQVIDYINSIYIDDIKSLDQCMKYLKIFGIIILVLLYSF